MRIAFYGGSFDPPHRGHLAVARAAAEAFALDSVLFAPTGRQPLKTHPAEAAFEDRLTMVGLLCAGSKDLQAADVDAPRMDGAPNYTVDALRRLREGPAEDAELFAIVGADAFLELRRWRESDALLALAEWVVVSRPGFSLDSLQPLKLSEEQREQIHRLGGVEVPISATVIRQRMRDGLDCSSLLTPEVYEYIRERRLYERA